MVAKIGTSLTAVDGSQYVTLTDGAGNLATANTGTPATTVTTPADALTNTGNVSQTEISLNYVFNSTTWDRVRSLGAASQLTATGQQTAVIMPHTAANAAIAATVNAAAGSSQIIKASVCNLYSVSCTSGASAGYLLVYNLAAAPGDGTVTPIDVIICAANTSVSKTYSIPLRCSAGATVVFSTTGPFTQTSSATAFLGGQAV